MSFETKYWFLFMPVIILLAIGTVFLLYYRNIENNELTKNQVKALMGLRFISLLLISFLLLSPFIKNIKKAVQYPLIITAWDNSASIISTSDSLEVIEKMNQLKNLISDELGKDYEIRHYSFGQSTEIVDQLDFSGKGSNYSQMISDIINNHYNENIGALIVAGDGIYNKGKNPVNMLKDINFPVYTIGFGDTTEVADALVQNIRVNRTSFSGNKFPVEIDTRFSRLKDQALKLVISQDDKKVTETVINPTNNDYFKTHKFTLEAGKPGLKHYTVSLEVAKNEQNKKNNTDEFFINVLENKQNILILSDGPHPDIGAITYSLEQQQSYDVSVFTEEPYPSKLSDFNLVILYQLPTPGKSMSQLINSEEYQRLPLLFTVGNKTFIPQLNALARGTEIQPLTVLGEEAQAVVNPSFASFTLSEDTKEFITKLPPLIVPFANYKLEPEYDILFHQNVNNIETDKPLIASGVYKGRKTGYIFGEGIWRWRLYNYYFNQTHNHFNEIVTQLVQFLALRENEDNFMIIYEPVYDEIDDIILKAEVYNDSFEPINGAEVIIVIQNEQGEEFEFTFDAANDEYILNAGNLPVSNYTFDAKVTIGKDTYREKGNFAVSPVNIENIFTRANHRVLYQLATQSGGDFFVPDQANKLINQLENNNRLEPINYLREILHEIINLRWLFFVILVILSLEWFLRKYWGLY